MSNRSNNVANLLKLPILKVSANNSNWPFLSILVDCHTAGLLEPPKSEWKTHAKKDLGGNTDVVCPNEQNTGVGGGQTVIKDKIGAPWYAIMLPTLQFAILCGVILI